MDKSKLTLKYSAKQASPERMEASFNSDYDLLLDESEIIAYALFIKAIERAIGFFNDLGINSVSRDLANSAISTAFAELYATVGTNFAEWYSEAFSYLSQNTPSDIAILVSTVLSSSARVRSEIVTSNIVTNLERRYNLDNFSPEASAERLARTETNGVANLAVETAAIGMFTDSSLYKRWISVGDERVRSTHRQVASQKPIPQSQLYQVGDTFMRFPSDPQAFGGNVAGEVINCRCRSVILPTGFNTPNFNALNGFLFGGELSL